MTNIDIGKQLLGMSLFILNYNLVCNLTSNLSPKPIESSNPFIINDDIFYTKDDKTYLTLMLNTINNKRTIEVGDTITFNNYSDNMFSINKVNEKCMIDDKIPYLSNNVYIDNSKTLNKSYVKQSDLIAPQNKSNVVQPVSTKNIFLDILILFDDNKDLIPQNTVINKNIDYVIRKQTIL